MGAATAINSCLYSCFESHQYHYGSQATYFDSNGGILYHALQGHPFNQRVIDDLAADALGHAQQLSTKRLLDAEKIRTLSGSKLIDTKNKMVVVKPGGMLRR